MLSCQNKAQKSAGFCVEKVSQDFVSVTIRDISKGKVSNGQKVQVDGFFHYNFEDVAIYPSNRSISKAIWVDFYELNSYQDSTLENLAGKKVTILGTIDLTSKGHLDSYVGTIRNVICRSLELI